MKSHRENPEGEENQEATKQSEREVFALKMMAKHKCEKCDQLTFVGWRLCKECEDFEEDHAND